MDLHAANIVYNPFPATQTVHFLVGPDGIPLSGCRSLLREHCPLLTHTLMDEQDDSINNPIKLPHEDPDAMAGLLWWVHDGNTRIPDDYENAPSFDIFQMIKIWVLAGRYSMPLLQNRMAEFAELTFASLAYREVAPEDVEIDSTVLKYLLDNTDKDSEIRHLYLNFIAYSRPKEETEDGGIGLRPLDDEYREDIPLEMLDEIAMYMDARVCKGARLGWTAVTDIPNSIMLRHLLDSLDPERRRAFQYLLEEMVLVGD